MKKLVILGAGGHGKVAADCALCMGYSEIEFLDDNRMIENVLHFPVVGGTCEVEKYDKNSTDFFVAIGNNRVRMDFLHRLVHKGYNVATIIHPEAILSKFIEIGVGAIVMPGAIVNAGTKIGTGSIINTGVRIDHDCRIGDGTHISPGAVLSGAVKVGDGTWICSSAVISNNISIGINSIVAMGAAVVDDVDDFVLVAGVPAEIKKTI